MVVTIHWWSLYTGGHYTLLVTIHWWSLYNGGHYTMVVTIQWWSLYNGGHNTQVTLTTKTIPNFTRGIPNTARNNIECDWLNLEQ